MMEEGKTEKEARWRKERDVDGKKIGDKDRGTVICKC